MWIPALIVAGIATGLYLLKSDDKKSPEDMTPEQALEEMMLVGYLESAPVFETRIMVQPYSMISGEAKEPTLAFVPKQTVRKANRPDNGVEENVVNGYPVSEGGQVLGGSIQLFFPG